MVMVTVIIVILDFYVNAMQDILGYHVSQMSIIVNQIHAMLEVFVATLFQGFYVIVNKGLLEYHVN